MKPYVLTVKGVIWGVKIPRGGDKIGGRDLSGRQTNSRPKPKKKKNFFVIFFIKKKKISINLCKSF